MRGARGFADLHAFTTKRGRAGAEKNESGRSSADPGRQTRHDHRFNGRSSSSRSMRVALRGESDGSEPLRAATQSRKALPSGDLVRRDSRTGKIHSCERDHEWPGRFVQSRITGRSPMLVTKLTE